MKKNVNWTDCSANLFRIQVNILSKWQQKLCIFLWSYTFLQIWSSWLQFKKYLASKKNGDIWISISINLALLPPNLIINTLEMLLCSVGSMMPFISSLLILGPNRKLSTACKGSSRSCSKGAARNGKNRRGWEKWGENYPFRWRLEPNKVSLLPNWERKSCIFRFDLWEPSRMTLSIWLGSQVRYGWKIALWSGWRRWN